MSHVINLIIYVGTKMCTFHCLPTHDKTVVAVNLIIILSLLLKGIL